MPSVLTIRAMRSSGLRYLCGVIPLLASACTRAGTMQAEIPSSVPPAVAAASRTQSISVPGVPNLPDLVTVLPIMARGHGDGATKVFIPAAVGGRHGMFILDTGDPVNDLNRDYVKLSSTGGLDTVLAGEAVPKEIEKGNFTVKLGTLQTPQPVRTRLDHAFGGFRVLAPRLGNIGVVTLEPFETIVDYTHRRVILIKLDSAGNRLATVPAYTVQRTVPLVLVDRFHWGIEGRIGDVIDKYVVDTGNPIFLALQDSTIKRIAAHLKTVDEDDWIVDHLDVAGRKFDSVPAERFSEGNNNIGYEFLKTFGVVGFNFRAHQLIFYQTT